MTLTTIILSSAVVSSLVSALFGLVRWRLDARTVDRQRRREVYAEAFARYTAYLEYPYRIRRRQPENPMVRTALSDGLSELQSEIAYFEAWIDTESPEIGKLYRALTSETRRVAGAAMSEAWQGAGASCDAEMNSPAIDTSGLREAERRYLDAVRSHLN